MTTTPGYKILCVTSELEAWHIYEEIYVMSKGISHHIGSMYGDPQCACIDKDNKWCLIGGAGLLLWTPKAVKAIEGIKDIYAIRQTGEYTAEILTDPWADDSAIWQLDINTLTLIKLKDFTAHAGKPYSQNVVW